MKVAKPLKMQPWFGYMAIDAAGRPCWGERNVRVYPIAKWHLMPGQRSARVAVVELPEPKKRRRKERA